jgi:hypothetical protein
MTKRRRLVVPTVLAGLLSACAPAVDTVRLSPVPYPPRPADFRIRMYSTERPQCPFEEIGTVRARKPNWFVSMEDVAESVRQVARELGGDAVIGVTNASQISGGTVIGSSVSVDTDPVLSGTVIRFTADDCRQ